MNFLSIISRNFIIRHGPVKTLKYPLVNFQRHLRLSVIIPVLHRAVQRVQFLLVLYDRVGYRFPCRVPLQVQNVLAFVALEVEQPQRSVFEVIQVNVQLVNLRRLNGQLQMVIFLNCAPVLVYAVNGDCVAAKPRAFDVEHIILRLFLLDFQYQNHRPERGDRYVRVQLDLFQCCARVRPEHIKPDFFSVRCNRQFTVNIVPDVFIIQQAVDV